MRIKILLFMTDSQIIEDKGEMANAKPHPKGFYDASNFFLSEECSDVKLRVGESIFPAHKLILSCN